MCLQNLGLGFGFGFKLTNLDRIRILKSKIRTSLECSVKDLGVFISHDLKWARHTLYIHNTASARASQILHAFSSRNVWTLRHAFLTYARPILEYNILYISRLVTIF